MPDTYRNGFPPIRITEEIDTALRRGDPVVALESNVIAHGFRRPGNIAVGREVEQVVRDGGAVPATTAIVDGSVVIGLADTELERLATAPGVAKVSSRDIAVALAGGGLGATTISATMALAQRVGIGTVASAGLGGVHRGAEDSLDISSDLTELARTELIVVCAGVKKILDIGRTLEFLETQGTPVIGYRYDRFPAFYCRDSGFPVPVRIDEPARIAEVARLHREFTGSGSVLVTHPIPEADAVDSDTIEVAITQALADAAAAGITGPAVTTAVLRAVDAATGGTAAAANHAVLLSTTVAATEIEVARAAAQRIGGSPEPAARVTTETEPVHAC